ncbi:hypothetical protein ACOMHN_036089 [Nucella lapillus]
MDGLGGVSSSALLSRLSVWLAIFIHNITFCVKADDHTVDSRSKEKDEEEDEDWDLCEERCDYGCCDHLQCCQPPTDIPRFSIQAIAVVGACVVTLALLCLCITRYRMAAKISRQNNNAHQADSGRCRGAVGSSSVCSSVPGPHSGVCWNPLRTLIMLEEGRQSASNLHTPAGLIVAPPPYSECAPQGSALDPQQLPPPYEEVVKDSDHCVTATSSSSSSSSSTPAEDTRE